MRSELSGWVPWLGRGRACRHASESSFSLHEKGEFIASLIFCVLAVMIFSLLYQCLTLFGHGIGRESSLLSDTSLGKGLCLILVAVPSLGYGDMHPVGWSKAVACIELLMGMIIFGVLIAKITPRRLSLYVSRLIYGSYARDYLDKMSEIFERISDDLERWGSDYSTRYEGINGARNVKIRLTLIRDLGEIASNMESHIESLHEYTNREVKQTDYFQNISTDSIVQLGRSSDKMLYILGQIMMSLSPQSRIKVLQGNIRRKIGRAAQAMLEISEVIDQHKGASDRQEVRTTFKGVGRECSSISKAVGEAPDHFIPNQIDLEPNDLKSSRDAKGKSETMQYPIPTVSHGGDKMYLIWTKCQAEIWCKLNNVNLEHSHFNDCQGVYIIWHGGRKPAVVYVGQGDIKARIQDHRCDPAIQQFELLTLYVTWADVPDSSWDGVEAFLAKRWTPKVGTNHPSADPIEVNSPWD